MVIVTKICILKPIFKHLCPKIFSTFPKLKKSINFEHELVQNHYIDQIWPKFPSKLQKTAIFTKKRIFFKIFGAFGAENLEFYVPKIPGFLELGPPLRPGFPQSISGRD